ncbi:hypothetical protein SAMN07250955_102312 [Arboricoccus pini]|uniref:Uncharacterized protein n=1 Tax=Arboricoccus pini TaxID=1963835 RepID=A0A212QQM8_9PROT|nr:hypothetical protein [Arboricoccus pini]SNB61646.1 hypothetical protein SAMN07250955_102312 [Arboricoccus pini]
MAAPGCLLIVLLPLLGGLIGHWAGGNAGMVWGLGLGAIAGVAIGAGMVWMLAKMKHS